jgi:uncharacterized membrane protein YeaQ/YmgE (transglycosylase-associated protein family)
MGILLWIIFGFIVGAIAKWIVPGEGPGGVVGDMLVGIAGALIGGWLSSLLGGHAGISGTNMGSLVSAIIGAVVLLWILRAVSGRRTVA